MTSSDLIQQAAERYRTVQAETPDLTQESFGIVETTPGAELKKARNTRLNRAASTNKARALALDATLSGQSVRSQSDVIESISQERVIGSSDLRDINFLELAVAMSRAVGRIIVGNGFGTGFLVGPGLIMTNHHVLETEDAARHSLLQLDYQDNSSGDLLPAPKFRVDPEQFFATDKDLDFTIASVTPDSDLGRNIGEYPWIQLIPEVGKADVGDSINVIQHPRGGLKQIAFRENQVIAMPRGQPSFLYYTTDTEPGSSGSPCFNDQWELVALHHSGVPEMDGSGKLLKKDNTIWRQGIDDPDLLHWIANEGVRISMIVAFLKAASLKPEFKDRAAQMLSLRPPNPIELARASSSPASPKTQINLPGNILSANKVSDSMSNGQTWTIPLQITISVGQPQPAGSALQPVVPTAVPQPATPGGPGPQQPGEGLQEIVTIDPNWAARPGYDPKFLEGFTVPLPKLTAALQQDTAEVSPDFRKHGNKFELTYWNYSVVMNKRRRTAWFAASNIDGDSKHRFNLGPRQDKWFKDPRISTAEQLGQEAFESGIDRGHLARRDDAAWGKTEAETLKANNDTFHFTNCSLQASMFNRGKDRWQGLEQFLLENKAKKENRKITVFTGPLFAANDPKYQNDKMDYVVRCPLSFWKVCVIIRQDGSMSATAFTLGQDEIKDLAGFEEKFDAADAQVTIKDLEKKIGLDFGDLKKHDHFASGGAPGTLEINEIKIRPISSFDDIVV
jgi:endonuclease G